MKDIVETENARVREESPDVRRDPRGVIDQPTKTLRVGADDDGDGDVTVREQKQA